MWGGWGGGGGEGSRHCDHWDELHGHEERPGDGCGQVDDRVLCDDTRAGIVAEGATELVVQNRAAAAVAFFDACGRDQHIAGMRERDRATGEGLNCEECSEAEAFHWPF